jgi:tetratricopeptide (TPR) repeat protein
VTQSAFLRAGFVILFFSFVPCISLLAAVSSEDQSKIASLNKKVGQLYQAGKFAEAIPIAQKSLQLSEKTRGKDARDTATSLDDLGLLYIEMADYAKAEPLLQRSLKIYEKARGSEYPDTAVNLSHLGRLYFKTGNYARAEPLYQRALKITEKALGADHLETAKSLNNLALLYGDEGDYAKAEPLLQRALKICEKALGLEHPYTASAFNNLALHYQKVGDYAKAEPLYQRALKIAEKARGPEHPSMAVALQNLASFYDTMGDYAKAEPLYQRALKITEKAMGSEHPDTATMVSFLAIFYVEVGDYAKAEPLLQRALKICEKVLGPDHPDTGGSLTSLAYLYCTMGYYAKAEPLLQRALKIGEKALGQDHPDTASALNQLAELYRKVHDYTRAEPLYQRALRIREKVLGPKHRDTATSFNNLGLLYRDMGDYSRAKPLVRQAIDINKQALGLEHPYTAKVIRNLSLIEGVAGDSKEALRLAIDARRGEERTLSNILSFTSEQQRLEFQKTTKPYDLPGTLGKASELAEIVLREKGVVLDSLLEDRLVAEASADAKQRETVNELRGTKQRLMKLQLEMPKDVSEQALKKRETAKNELSKRIEKLEAGLARQVGGLGRARRALSVTVPQVQAAFGKNDVLIELLRYQHYLGKDKFEGRYGAVVIPPMGEPKWIPLGACEEIEKNVHLYQKSVRGQTDEQTLSSVLYTLHEQLWAPMEKALPPETKTVIISPDGELSFVSFATLVGPDDKFIGAKYSVRYVASGRDLLREFRTAGNAQTSVYANPDFGGKPTSRDSNREIAVALRSIEMRDLQNISLPPLPGTAEEAAALEKRFGDSAKVFLGSNATKAELRQVNAPHILHLATHGFFLPEVDLGKPIDPLQADQEIPKGKLLNPMHRSGLALAGAQTTLQAWGRGETPPIENNGIVTAEEVGGLKLDGTWLVVLSACETGSGQARAGEGVMGLRRGFIQAGAQNLLMTLWPISDETTVQIMLDFYDAALKSGNAPQALADTERDWLVKLRKERGLLDAVRLAGPFIMSSQGKQ